MQPSRRGGTAFRRGGTASRRLDPVLGALLLPVVLAACGGGGSTPSASHPTTSSAAGRTTTTSAPATTTSAPAPTATTAAPTMMPMQTPTGGEFLSPSGNIGCEIDYHRSGLTYVYCQTRTPPRSVKLTATGTVVTRCSGQQCLGNAGVGTPILAYGRATGVGPYRCVSATTGVTCTANGRGFRISKSGVTPVTS